MAFVNENAFPYVQFLMGKYKDAESHFQDTVAQFPIVRANNFIPPLLRHNAHNPAFPWESSVQYDWERFEDPVLRDYVYCKFMRQQAAEPYVRYAYWLKIIMNIQEKYNERGIHGIMNSDYIFTEKNEFVTFLCLMKDLGMFDWNNDDVPELVELRNTCFGFVRMIGEAPRINWGAFGYDNEALSMELRRVTDPLDGPN